MLRPERMAKVSVTGARAVMPTVIETMHDLHLVHLSDYDGTWAGFDNGDPIEGAEEASGKLVTVRALESALDLAAADVDPQPELPDGWEERLERVRVRVNELDDERTALRDERRRVEERIDRLSPFADLGIDLDLLSGYDSVDVVVGEGDRAAIERELDAADDVRAFETFAGDDVVAIVAAPTGDDPEGLVDDALVGVEFTPYEVPDVDGTPGEYLAELVSRRRRLEDDLAEVERDLDRVAREEGSFLLRVEEELTIEVDRAEAPLRFATTERAFVTEGWIPAERYDAFEVALRDAVGDRVEIELLEVADYDEHAHGAVAHTGSGDGEREETDDAAEEAPEREPAMATDGGERAAAGATGAVTMDEEPPVVLDNLTPAKPFEVMVKLVSQPKYSELDPTLLIFLTYPFAFGFMIGDVGYGLLYMALGYGAWKIFDSDAGKAIGTIGIWAGAFTFLFGWLYDDMFGVHMHDFVPASVHHVMTDYLFAASLTKGLQETEWALLWIVLAILFGIVHLNAGLVLGFVNELRHGLKAAVYERLSYILAMNGLFVWIFSHADAGSFDHGIEFLPADLTASGMKPEFLVGTSDEAVLYEFVGFAGLPEVVGVVGIAAFLIGFVMIGIGEGAAGIAETPAWTFGHVLSYLRLTAVLLAKGGMAFAVNLLVFGGYTNEEGYTAFGLPGYDVSGYETDFAGLIHIEPLWLTIPIAILLFVLGHVLVLALGITAAGIQMLRLEYVEFFQKFYEGGGEEYEPFGHERSATGD